MFIVCEKSTVLLRSRVITHVRVSTVSVSASHSAQTPKCSNISGQFIRAQTSKLFVAMANVSVSMKDLVVLTVSIEGGHDEKIKSRQYSIPTHLIDEFQGSKYLCISRKEVCVRRLLTIQARPHVNTSHADEGITNISLTDVPDQLIKRRQDAMKLAVTGAHRGTEKAHGNFMIAKKYQQAIFDLGDTISITTPEVCGIEPILMNVKTNYHGPIWFEITDLNMSWITKAVGAQVAQGSYKSKRARLLVVADDVDGADSGDDDDVSGTGEADVGPTDPSDTDAVVAVNPSQDVEDVLPPMPRRSPTPETPAPKRSGKITSFFKQHS